MEGKGTAQVGAALRRLLEAFSADPSDPRALRTLERGLFVAGAWRELSGVYEARLSLLSPQDPEWVLVGLRLASLLEDRIGDSVSARRRYEAVLREEPMQPRALAGMRRSYAREGSLTQALQIAELEESQQLPPTERARMLGEVGELWQDVGEVGEAERRFLEALRLDPECDAALAGASRIAEARGDRTEALRLSERRLFQLRGPARADALERMAALLPDQNDRRVRELLREALRESPDRKSVARRLLDLELASGAFDRADEIGQRLLTAASTPSERSAITLELAAAMIERGDDARRALAWVNRAREAGVNDAPVHRLRARALRRIGDNEALVESLERLVDLPGASALESLELAALHERAGRFERAVEHLLAALASDPNDSEALAILDRCLARLGRDAERADVIGRRLELAEGPAERSDLANALGDLLAGPLDDPEGAELVYRRARSESPAPSANEKLAELYRKRGRFQALADLLLQTANGTGEALERAAAWRGLAHLRTDALVDLPGAHDAWLRSLELDPDSTEALDGLHKLAERAARPAWSVSACEHELAREPSDERVAQILPRLLASARAAGDLQRALEAAERWVALRPSAESCHALATLARELGDPAREAAALDGLDRSLAADPAARAAARARRADLALARGDAGSLEEAVAAYRESLEIVSDPARRERLIDLLESAGDFGAVARELELALAESPDSRPLRLRLARVLERTADTDRIAGVLGPLVGRDPVDAEAADLLEQTLVEAGRVQPLCELLRRRLRAEPDATRARELGVRFGELALDALALGAETAAALAPLADPAHAGRLEEIYERALSASGAHAELAEWLGRREPALEGNERVEVLLRRAAALDALGRSDEAADCAELAEAVAGPERRAELRIALVARIGRIAEPTARLERLGNLLGRPATPDECAELRIARSTLLESIGRRDDAAAELDAAHAEAPHRTDVLRALVRARRLAGPSRALVRALETLSGAVDDPAERARALLEVADLLLSSAPGLHDAEAAERTLLAIRELDPDHAGAIERLARRYEDTDRPDDLARLLEERIAEEALPAEARAAYALRLGERWRASGEPARAAAVLRAARASGAGGPAADLLLLRCLEDGSDLRGKVELCAERARATSAGERAIWRERWLEALRALGAPSAERLTALDALLEDRPGDSALLDERLVLLREAGHDAPLAAALERAIDAAPPDDPRRRARVRELVDLYEGALALPDRALARIEREVSRDPELRRRGAKLAAAQGDLAREIALLEPLAASEPAVLEPDSLRHLALGLVQVGRHHDALPVVRRAIAALPGDAALARAEVDVLRDAGDHAAFSAALERLLPLSPGESPQRLVREGFEAAERGGDAPAALRWLRRWRVFEPLPGPLRSRWATLEGQLGDFSQRRAALEALVASADSAEERARLHASLAELDRARGDLALAEREYGVAMRESRRAPHTWLSARERLLEALGHDAQRVELLRALADHADSPAAERVRARQALVELLCADPERAEEAAEELRRSLLVEAHGEPTERAARMRRLLELCDRLERDADWCSLAERLIPLVLPPERRALERERARRLLTALGAEQPARRAWSDILVAEPEDAEALAALGELARQPGRESERAALLERRAELAQGSARAALFAEAAGVRWRALGDAALALRDLERSLESEGDAPTPLASLELQAELCRQLGRSDAEATALRALLAAGAGHAEAPRWLRLAESLLASGGSADEAADAAERALATDAPDATVRSRARSVLEHAGRFERAAEVLCDEAAAATGEARGALLRHLARVALDDLGDARRACGALEDLARGGDTTAADDELWARALDAHGRTDEALARRSKGLEKLGPRARPERWVELAQSCLARAGGAAQARAACDRALALEATDLSALRLRADLSAKLADFPSALEDTVRLGEALRAAGDSALAFARAARIARIELRDPARAGELYGRALERDPSCVEALLGAGEIALDRGDAERANRALSLVCGLLDGTEPGPRLARAARAAAEAAVLLGRDAEAVRHLEVARREAPGDPEVLDRLAEVALKAGSAASAREALEARLAVGDLEGRPRATRVRALARAFELAGEHSRARESLEEVLRLDPDDVDAFERLVAMLEAAGEHASALARLESRLAVAPREERPAVALRTARLEASLGRRPTARARLEALAQGGSLPREAWPDLVAWTLADSGPEATLALSARALRECDQTEARAGVLWTEAQALAQLRREPEAARRACEALRLDPTRLDAARLLATHVGQVGDWEAPVSALERALEVGAPSPALEAEIREAIGRAYAGPLENLERARSEYRRALARNPERESAREALADSTAFDPATHDESLAMHATLLDSQPARAGSWRAVGRIAAHRHREAIQLTAEAVLQSLSSSPERAIHDSRPPLVVEVAAAENPALSAASDLLAALEEVDALPATLVAPPPGRLPTSVLAELSEIGGRAWQLEDEVLRGLWLQVCDGADAPLQALPWRVRRRLRQTLRSPDTAALKRLDPASWRADLLARAAARALARRQLTVSDAIQGLAATWPETAHLDFPAGGSLAAIASACPPARALLGRIAGGCLAGLGLRANARPR